MGNGRGSLVLFAATLGGALLAGGTMAGLDALGVLTPSQAPAAAPESELDEKPLDLQERMDQARVLEGVGVLNHAVEQLSEKRLTRQRVDMLGHTYAVELMTSQYVQLPDAVVYKAQEGGAFVDFRLEPVGRDKKAAADALSDAAWGNPSLTFVVESAGETLRSDYRIGAVGEPRGAHPTVEAVYPGPISVPRVEGADYSIVVDGKPHAVTP